MFVYCNNNSSNLSDHSGSEPITIGLGIIACAFIIGAGVSALTTWTTGGSGISVYLLGIKLQTVTWSDIREICIVHQKPWAKEIIECI